MSVFTRRIRRILGPVLAGALCLTGLVGPLLDADLPSRTPVVESEHHPASCPPVHDHTICVQLGASQWTAARPAARPPDRPIVAHAPTAAVSSPRTSFVRTGHRSRAPPVRPS